MGRDGLTALTDLRAQEVSLVTRGANKKKRFPIFKKEPSMSSDFLKVLKSVMETETDAEAKLAEVFDAQKMSEQGMEAVRGALRILAGFKDQLPGDVMEKLASMAGYEPPSKEPGNEYTEPKEGSKDGDPVTKSELSPEVRAALEPVLKAQEDQIQALKEQVAKSEAALQAEREQRDLEAWVTKCQAELPFYPGKSADELGKMLFTLHKQMPELAASQFEAMKQASVTIEKSQLLSDAGLRPSSTGSATLHRNDTAWSKIQKMADGIVEKSNDLNLTKEKAIARVMKSAAGKELYNQYLIEHPAQTEPFRQ